MSWQRFVAVGDSFTEGMHDGPVDGSSLTGWADRLARALARDAPGLDYANLAVRGKKLAEVVDEQLDAALSLQPDLLGFHAGGNDVLRLGVDVDALLAGYDAAVARSSAPGRTVLLWTVLPSSTQRPGRLGTWLAERIAVWNAGVREVAARHDAELVDFASVAAIADRRLWHVDRLHLNPAGHERAAAAALDALAARSLDDRPDGWWREPLPGRDVRRGVLGATDDARWIATWFAPWIVRRLRGISSGDGRTARRPLPRPASDR